MSRWLADDELDRLLGPLHEAVSDIGVRIYRIIFHRKSKEDFGVTPAPSTGIGSVPYLLVVASENFSVDGSPIGLSTT